MKWAIAISALVLVAVFAAVGFWLRTLPPLTQSWSVMVEQPGLSPAELERTSTPIEHALIVLPGVRALRETCIDGHCEFSVEATLDTDVLAAVGNARTQLPDSFMYPTVTRTPVLTEERFLLTSGQMTVLEISRWAHDSFELKLARQPGVRGVEWCGLVHDEVKVELDVGRVRAVGQKADEIADSLGAVRTFDQTMTLVREVARVERGASKPDCLALRDGRAVLIATVRHEGDHVVKLPVLPPWLTLESIEAPVEEWLSTTEQAPRLPRLVLVRGHRITSFAQIDGPPPGLELIKRKRGVAIQVLGDREVALPAAQAIRDALAKEPGWTGVVPNLMLPEQRMEADRPDARRLVVRLLRSDVGHLDDGTPITMKLDEHDLDATLSDGSPLSAHVKVTLTQRPESLLRLDAQDAFEFFTSVEDPQRVLKTIQLPAGVQVRVTGGGH